MSTVLEGLRYAESHEWVKAEGEYAYVGITDYAQHALGDIVYVDMPDVDDEVEKGEEFGAVESVKAASDLYSPVTGVVVEVNEVVHIGGEQRAFADLRQSGLVNRGTPTHVKFLEGLDARSRACP